MSDLLGPEWHNQVRDDYEAARELTTVDHVWVNGFACINPTDEFAAEVGRDIIKKIMAARDRRVAITFNAS